MANRKKCKGCGHYKFSFLIRKGADGKVRCDACETDRIRKSVKVPVTWEDHKAKRQRLLLDTDWIESDAGKGRAGPQLTASLLEYRQNLFDMTANFRQPEDVVWPINPLTTSKDRE